jgi:multiple sugar transport system ATP-binding protein
MRSEIKRLHQELAATMIYVTHDQIEAMTLADRIVLMNAGEIEQSGSPLELYERPKTRFVAGFLGSPKINFITASLTESGVRFADGQTMRLPSGAINRYKNHLGKAVVFAIRPQHIDRAGEGRTANITSRIDLVQPTGARTYVTFAIGPESVMAELDAHDAGKPGDELKVAFDLDHFMLIEPVSGKVLG